jgi:hypothetical protein
MGEPDFERPAVALPALPVALPEQAGPSPESVHVTLRADIRRRAVNAAATNPQLAAICAATPADDAEPMHKSESVIAFTPAFYGAGWMATDFIPGKTSEREES